MTQNENLKIAEKMWLDTSQEEKFFFQRYPEPSSLRRSTKFPGALASLKFGEYQGMDNKWITNERAVWLGMIVSDSRGSGGQLLNALTRVFTRLGLSLIGTPTPLKPRDWDGSRPFDNKQENLICWYLRHGFRIIQNGSETRVVHVSKMSALDVSFTLK